MKCTCKSMTYNVPCRYCIYRKLKIQTREQFEKMMQVVIDWDEQSVVL